MKGRNLKSTATKNIPKSESFDWNRVIVLTRRNFHDDWDKIVDRLREQTESEVQLKPFHAEKALLFFKDPTLAKMLCKNKGWSTVDTFYVKFDQWTKKFMQNQNSFRVMVAGTDPEVYHSMHGS